MKKLAISGGLTVGKVTASEWPIHGQLEIDAVTEVIKSGKWGLDGTKIGKFEETFAAYCGTKHAITSVNGTVTLRLAMEALGVCPGDEVIVPGLTFQATAATVLDVNAVPILVDVDPRTYTLDPKAVRAAITPKTRGIIPVHLYGRVADMDELMQIAKEHGLFVIEDCAHQHGSEWDGKRVGSIGDIGSFSLQAYKILCAGEGGVLTTNDDRLSDLLYSLRHTGTPVRPGAPTMQSGNYRITELQAALLLAQMTRLDAQNALRESNVLYMENRLKDVEGIRILYRNPKITKQSYFRWVLQYDDKCWDGVPIADFLEAFYAETERSIYCSRPYAQLNDSPQYQPHSKNTHRLSDEYWNAIDPKRFDLPVCKRAVEDEAFCFYHSILLGSRESCDNIVDAIIKIRENSDELKEFSRKK